MKAYKGFDKNMQCRGFQYEEGKTYHEETADLCFSGFHACENPLDVFAYYAPKDGSIYREVELDEVSDKTSDDSKVCGKTIRIGAKLSVRGICDAHFEYVKSHCIAGKGRAAGKAGAVPPLVTGAVHPLVTGAVPSLVIRAAPPLVKLAVPPLVNRAVHPLVTMAAHPLVTGAVPPLVRMELPVLLTETSKEKSDALSVHLNTMMTRITFLLPAGLLTEKRSRRTPGTSV